MKTKKTAEKITAQNSRNHQSKDSKYNADDYRHAMIREWYDKHSGSEKTDAQLESFLKSKGVKSRVCSITKKKFYGFDNNAFPFAGRCSNQANQQYVIPARLSRVTPEMIENYGGNKKFADYMDECLGRNN